MESRSLKECTRGSIHQKKEENSLPMMVISDYEVGTPYNKNLGFVNPSGYSTNSFLRIRGIGINLDMVNGQQYLYACPN